MTIDTDQAYCYAKVSKICPEEEDLSIWSCLINKGSSQYKKSKLRFRMKVCAWHRDFNESSA